MHTLGLTFTSAAFLAASLVAPAQARTDQSGYVVGKISRPDVRRISVSYADLNLANDREVKLLTRRVSGAAEQVCDVEHFIQPLSQSAESHRCFRQAMTRASRDIEIAVSRVRGGSPVASLPPIRIDTLASR